MITNNELNIANNSYTKKDFYQIYPEILDQIKAITSRWDPESTNESDPGIVLVKLLAFVADKINYNIDKNILEDFMVSATQEDSMRKLCDMMGYDMRYYVSAVTPVSFVWMEELASGETIHIPAGTDITSSADDNINYVTLEEVQLTDAGVEKSVAAIEGKLVPLTLGDSSLIKLYNLDDNKRLYLPEPIISENGVFVKQDIGGNKIPWTLVSNLYTQVAGSTVYKFGYDSSKKLPYIEFPKDIDTLIKDGLEVSYLRTTGESGNVKAKVLDSIRDISTVTKNGESLTDESIEYLLVGNVSATTSGANPETLDEAYNSFKKTVGTFDTLVTCRDYANAIYNLVDNDINRKPLVSNAQVSDIRDDLNRSYRIMSFNDFGLCFRSVPKIEGEEPQITNFDLFIYPYKAITGGYDKKSYTNSFKPDQTKTYQISSRLEENKTISHEIKDLEPTDLFAIKNYYKLSAKINTNYKVNSAEEKAILSNISEAIYKKFNCRNVDFGEELVYEEILKTIENADSRIKNVSLDDPDLESWYMLANGTENKLIENGESYGAVETDSKYIDLVVKNIIAGRLRMFKYSNMFNKNFGESKVPGIDESELGVAKDTSSLEVTPDLTDSIVKISTELAIDFNGWDANTSYTLKDNENITFWTANWVDDYIYSYGVAYRWIPSDDDLTINAGDQYKLSGDDILLVRYQNKDGKYIKRKFTSTGYTEWQGPEGGEIQTASVTGPVVISPDWYLQKTIAAYPGEDQPNRWSIRGPFNFGGTVVQGLGALSSNQQLGILKQQAQVLNPTENNSFIPILWITKKGYLEAGHILEEGEYFFYSNSNYTSLVTFGTGTQIGEPDEFNTLQSNTSKNINLDDIVNEGINSIANESWYKLKTDTITITENRIINLAKGCKIRKITLDDSETVIDNTKKVALDATYLLPDAQSWTTLPGSPAEWYVRSRLNVNTNPDNAQILYAPKNTEDIQEIGVTKTFIVKTISSVADTEYTYEDHDWSPTTSTGDICVKSNYYIQEFGNDDIDVRVFMESPVREDTDIEVDDLCMYCYSNDSAVDASGEKLSLDNFDNNYTSIPDGSQFNEVTLPVNISAGNLGLIMIYVNQPEDTIEESGLENISHIQAFGYNGSSIESGFDYYHRADGYSLEASGSDNKLKIGLNVIKVPSTVTSIKIIGKQDRDVVIFSNLSVIPDNAWKGIDLKHLGFKSEEESGTGISDYILDQIAAACGDNFFYNAPLDNNILMDEDSSDPLSWYDSNNLFNKFTLSEIDPDLSNIQLTKASKLK